MKVEWVLASDLMIHDVGPNVITVPVVRVEAMVKEIEALEKEMINPLHANTLINKLLASLKEGRG